MTRVQVPPAAKTKSNNFFFYTLHPFQIKNVGPNRVKVHV